MRMRRAACAGVVTSVSVTKPNSLRMPAPVVHVAPAAEPEPEPRAPRPSPPPPPGQPAAAGDGELQPHGELPLHGVPATAGMATAVPPIAKGTDPAAPHGHDVCEARVTPTGQFDFAESMRAPTAARGGR